MFGTIRKHQTWLWLVIITLTIISFVVFFSPYSKMHDTRSGGNYGSVDGQKVTREDFAKAQREVYLRYLFTTGRWPDQDARRRGFDDTRETYQWLLLIRKQDELGVSVSAEAIAKTGRELLSNFERQGLANTAAFTKEILEPKGFTLPDFERFVTHYLGMQEMMALAGSSGKLVTPQEAQALYIRENRPLSTGVVLFTASNYLSKVTVTPGAVAEFYTNYLANYRIPDRIEVAYVTFGVSNFLTQAEAELSRSNLNEIVEANVQRMGTNYFGGAKTPEESKANMRKEIIHARAQNLARRAANDFARPLFETNTPAISDLEKEAKAQKLQVSVTQPFSRETGPSELQVGQDFVKVAFSRTDEDPFLQPVVTRDAVYVVGLQKKIPSEIPPLAKIQRRVEEDFRMNQAAMLARQAGESFHTALTNGLASGKSFSDLCKSVGQTPIQLEDFSLVTRQLKGNLDEQVPLNLIKQLAFSTDTGKASQFQPTRDGGVILFVRAILPVDEEKMKQEMPDFIDYVRRKRTDEAFQAWFGKEAEKGLRNTPLGQEAAARQGES